jgi:hypothetical protein
MFLRWLNRLLGSSVWKVVGIIGGIGGLKYGSDSLVDWYDKNITIEKRMEEINNVVLTDKDKEIFKNFGLDENKEFSEVEMKEMKYEIVKRRKEQLLQQRLKELNKFEENLLENKYENINKKD